MSGVSPADTPAICPGPHGHGCDCLNPWPGCPWIPKPTVDPEPVSPADTIRRVLEGCRGAWVCANEIVVGVKSATEDEAPIDEATEEGLAALDALLAVGERDKADLRELRELVTQVHAALDGGDSPPFTHDSPKRIVALREAGERDKAEIERLRDRAVCSGCGQDVGESGICTYPGCDDGEMIPASDLPFALRAACDSMLERWKEWQTEAAEYEAERERDRRQIARLTEGVEPLVAACEVAFGSDGPWDDDEDVSLPGTGITFGQIRRARAVLADEEDAGNG